MVFIGAFCPSQSVAQSLSKVPLSSATITSTPWDIGLPANVIDGQTNTLMRSANVNPAFVQFEFDSPIAIKKLRVFLGESGFAGDVNSWWWEAADSPADLGLKAGSYQTAVTRTGVTGDWDETVLSNALSRRIWRFNIQRTVGDNYVHIVELELWSESEIPAAGPQVRVAYVIPANREPQPNGVAHIQNALKLYQAWYGDQMERNGFGQKTFEFETEADGLTPKVHTVYRTSDTSAGEDTWNKSITSAQVDGFLGVWSPKQVWWIISESHIQFPDGSLTNQFFGGAGAGSGDDPGVGVVSGDALARLDPDFWLDDTLYGGQTISAIGPYPLVDTVSFAWFEGTTFSSISSSVLGGSIHEVSHGFGLSHDFRNDQNFDGNLMGNGLRGIRGDLFPDRYTDYTRLTYAAALGLSVSRYFNSHASFTDNTPPTLSTGNSAMVAPVNGLLPIDFTAEDASGLHAAWLLLDGNLVGEMALNGTMTHSTFFTPYYLPGLANSYAISVFDTQGNKQTVNRTITVTPGSNAAPQPSVYLSRATVPVGGSVTLDARDSIDPDGDKTMMTVDWDLDGDGQFDTSPTTVKALSVQFSVPGDYLIRARLTDSLGAQSISTPLPLRVVAAAVVGRSVFYNNCIFDGNDPAASSADDQAIATDKVALLSGHTATFQNYTSYSKGINGIMIDVAGLPGTPDANDFLFKAGNDSSPDAWPGASLPSSVTIRRGSGTDGSDRITLVWPDHAIQNQWLQVTMKANARTGLANDDVFYFGNAIGECGNDSASAVVNVTDVALTRAHPRSPLAPAPVDFAYDYDRDGSVNVTDVAISRANQTSPLTALQLIIAP